MKKILLIHEDYAESSKVQTYLKKVGFDLVLQNHDQRLSDQILSLNPDVIVACGKQKFSSLGVGAKLKEISGIRAKIILILPQGERPSPQEVAKARVDMLIEMPIMPEKLIQVIAKLLGLDPNAFIEKYKKAKIVDPGAVDNMPKSNGSADPNESVMIRGTGFQREKVNINDQSRAENYKKFVQQMQIDKTQTSHTKQAIKSRQEQLKKGWDFDLLAEIDDLKRQFTRALFKK